MKTFSVVNSVVCFAKEVRDSIVLKLLNECNLSCKIVKNCILSEVCMIEAATHSPVYLRCNV